MMSFVYKQNSLWFCVVAGILQYLSFPPFSLWPLAFISLVSLFIFIWSEPKWWRILLGSYMYCILYAVLAIIFVPDPILLGGGALIWLCIFGPWVLLCKRFVKNPLFFFLLLPPVFGIAEYIAGNFSLLPAYLIMSGIALSGTPFQFTALFGGLLGVSIFTAFVNAFFAWSTISFFDCPRCGVRGVLAGMILLGLGWSASFFVSPASLPIHTMAVSTGEDFDLSIQPYNNPQYTFVPDDEGKIKNAIQALLAPIGKKIDQEHPALVVFPEEMIDLRLPTVVDLQAQNQIGVTNAGPLLEEYSAFAAIHNIYISTTLITFETDGKKYQSTILIDNQGNFAGLYHKQLLTIVSEEWPLGHWLPFYWRLGFNALPKIVEQESFITDNPTGPFSKGNASQMPFSVGESKAGSLICLEGHYPYLYSRWKNAGVQFIIFTDDNMWLGHGRSLYRALSSRIRTLESIHTGLPIIVSGKDEYPEMLYPDGTHNFAPLPAPDSFTEITN